MKTPRNAASRPFLIPEYKFKALGGAVACALFSALGHAAAPTTLSATPSAMSNAVTLALQSDQSGSGYFTLLAAGGDCGTGTQVKAGTDGSSAAALAIGSTPLSAGTPGSYTLRNLLAGTDYKLCFTADDGTTLQDTPISANFTTTAAVSLTNSWGTVGTAGFSQAQADYVSLAIAADGTPYVAFQDYNDSQKTTVMKFNGSTWVNVGSAAFSPGGAMFPSLALAPDGTPHVAFYDIANGGKASVMKFDGSAWVNVGSAGFSAGYANYTVLAFAPDGTPYVAYQDHNSSDKVTVMKYNGTTWGNVGSAGFSTGTGAPVLNFSPDGTPYVAYQDGTNGSTVKKFDGSAWVDVGSAGFSPGGLSDLSLKFAPNGTPYLSFRDGASGARATVMKFDGTNWVTVGSAGFSASYASFTALALAPDGTPYVAYSDGASGYKATAMKFDGSAWVGVGSAGFSAGFAAYNALAFAPNGTPYLAYRDTGNSNKATVKKLAPAGPTLSSVSVTATGTGTTADLVATSNLNGTGYWVVLAGASATAPSAAQVKAGQNSSGTTSGPAVIASGSAAMTAASAKTFSLTDLSAASSYTVCLVGANASGDSSVTCKNLATGPAFTSLSPATGAYIKASSSIGYTLNENIASGSLVFTRTSGTADPASPQTCTLQGTALSSGARSVGLGTNANGCAAAVSLVDGTTYSVALSGTDAIALNSAATSITGLSYDTSAPADAASAPIVGAKANANMVNTTVYEANDIVTVTFSEPVLVSSITGNAPAVSGGHSLGSPTIAAVSASNGYATSFTITLGSSGLSLAVADTLTFTAANVVDRAGNVASSDVVFTVPTPISLPAAPTGITATAGNASISVAFTAGADGGAAISEYTASCAPANTFASIDWTASQTGTASPITVSGLTNGTAYQCAVKAKNSAGYGVYSANSANATPVAPAVTGGDYTPPSNPTLPSGGGSVTPSAGQTVVVTDNGSSGSTIVLPPPTGTGTGTATPNSVAVQLPNSGGTVNVQSNTSGTQLGVQTTTLPGSTTPVTAVTVNSGSATFTATGSGQPVAGLKNGIIVVSGTSNSKVTVDTTGGAPTIGVSNTDTIIVPTGTQNVAGTQVTLPSPSNGGTATPVTVQTGTQTLNVQSTGSGSTISFATANIGGTTTPVVTVSGGSATVSGSGNGQPLVAVGGGNTVITGGGGSGSNRCNVVTEVTNSSSRDVVQVNTCYIVVGSGGTLRPGAYIAPPAANAFAEVKDGIVWAGETAEFDKNGNLIGAYLGTKAGNTGVVGDDTVPGGNKFTANGYGNSAFIPRLSGTSLRLNGAKLDESVFAVVNKTLGVAVVPATPAQSAQGVLNFQVSGDASAEQKAQAALTFNLSGDQVSVMPTRRIRVDTSRADGVSVGSEGNVEVTTGGLVTTFAPSVGDPQVFAAQVAETLPGATSELRWNGTWQVTIADGSAYVGRPVWSRQARAGAASLSAAGGNLAYHDGAYSQLIVPDFADYTTLQATFAKELGDAKLTVLPRLDGTAIATVNGQSYILAPHWQLVKADVSKPAWWLDNGVVYIKNADGTAQGFTVR